MKSSISIVFAILLAPLCTASSSTYQTPPEALVQLVDLPRTPSSRVSPDDRYVLVMTRAGLPTIAEVAAPELRLAGMRFTPNDRLPSYYQSFRTDSMTIHDLAEDTRTAVDIPDGRIVSTTFSPDAAHIAFLLGTDSGTSLWVIETATGKARALTEKILNPLMERSLNWTRDSRAIYLVALPADQGHAPVEPKLPAGPNIQETTGEQAAVRTYQDMLSSPHDEALLTYYTTGQVARVDLRGKLKRIGEPASIRSLELSPDGEMLLVETMHKPYSYDVPTSRFPRRIEVWDTKGRLVHRVADLPLSEAIPKGFDAVATGPRRVDWRADAPATLSWVEAADGGDPARAAEVRDRLMIHAAPFDGEPTVLAEAALRINGVRWANDDLAFVSTRWWRSRQVRWWQIAPGDPDREPVMRMDRSSENRYDDPGDIVMTRGRFGTSVMLVTEGDQLYLTGTGASPKGNIPFFDRWDLGTDTKERIWNSEAPYYERISSVLGNDGKRLLTTRESLYEPPNLMVRDLEADTLTAITDVKNPLPELERITKELIRYTRADGVQLTGTLYLPPGYRSGDGPLPLLMWAYPREYKDADAAGQVRTSPYAFVRLSHRGPLPYLLMGYAVLDGPTMPIIGEGDAQPNDAFREQLVASAKAAVDAVVSRGIADPERIAIGGHSYGAFMVANLLAHSDLFSAGIARSGAYNRTLTPFGFQAEERTFWEAADVYGKMSPFFHAEKIDEPMLMIHGEVDNNSGTFPIQSERMFHALKGLGGTTRLVMLPHESHGYSARESVLHTLWEQYRWLEKYLGEQDKSDDAS